MSFRPLLPALLLLPAALPAAAQKTPPAMTVRPAPFRRVTITGAFPKAQLERANHITVQADSSSEPLISFWRGVVLDGQGQDLQSVGARKALGNLSRVGVTLVRVAPFEQAGALRVLPSGTPLVEWRLPDAQIEAVSNRNLGVIFSLSPPPGILPKSWDALVKSIVRRYAKTAQGKITRWEFAGTTEQIQTLYAPFARTIRELVPDTPLGIRLTDRNTISTVTAAAKVCAAQKIPLDSLTWQAENEPDAAAKTLLQIRAVLRPFSFLRGTALLPDVAAQSPARMLTLATRLLAFSPVNAPHSLLGGMTVFSAAPDTDGQANAAGNVLALLNRMSGTGLNYTSDKTDTHCLATRGKNVVRVLLWREGTGGDGIALLRLKNLGNALRGAASVRIQRVSEAGTPELLTDVPAADLEIPVALLPGGFVLFEITPHSPPTADISLAASRFQWNSGEDVRINVTVRNNSQRTFAPDLLLRSSFPGLISSDIARQPLGKLTAGQSRTVAYLLPIPPLLRERDVFFNVAVGETSHAGIQVRIQPALALTVETPRLDLPRPGTRGTARLRLKNNGPYPLHLTVSAGGTEQQKVELPGHAPGLLVSQEVAAPSADPGLYPVALHIESTSEKLDAPPILLAVPLLCRKAKGPITIDGDLSEWTGAERMGMGRVEQTSGKTWHGPSDVSASAFVQWDETNFYFACDVVDDVFTQNNAASEMWRGDSVQFALSVRRNVPFGQAGYGAGDHEFGMALLKTGPTLIRFAGQNARPNGVVPGAGGVVRRDGNHTYYEAALPWSQITGNAPDAEFVFGISVLVNDCDGQERGTIAWGGGIAGVKRPRSISSAASRAINFS